MQPELKSLFLREASPGGVVLITHIQQAISSAAGEEDYVLVYPTENVAAENYELPVVGTLGMSDRNYDEALTNLLPPGPAWTRVTGSPGSAVLSVGAAELSRIDAIAMGLVKVRRIQGLVRILCRIGQVRHTGYPMSA